MMLNDIPSEIVFRIILYLSCNDISNLRLTSGRMRFHCDQPYLWRSIYLRPSSPPLKEKNYTEGHATVLWKLTDLKKIIDVHLEHIKSIQIWGVRDNIVHYLLSSCPNLHHLTICGWATLSDHCLKVLPSQTPLKLRTLKLIGTSEQMNFVSVDASALGKLLVQTPDMTDLVFGCKMHIHADILLNELEQSITTQEQQQKNQQFQRGYDLRYLILAAQSTWLHDHVVRLIKIFPRIQKIYLLSKLVYDDISCFFTEGDYSNKLETWLIEQSLINGYTFLKFDQSKSIPLIATDNMVIYDTSPLYNSA